MTDYVNHQVESSTPSDQQQRKPDYQKFDDDVAQKEGDGWLSEDAVNCQYLRSLPVPTTRELCPGELACQCPRHVNCVRVSWLASTHDT